MTKSKGYRFKTRRVFKKHVRKRGMLPLTYMLQDYNEGDRVDIIVEPSTLRGMPHRRYHGRTGIIAKHQGSAYIVHIKDGGKTKQIIARPEHLRLSN